MDRNKRHSLRLLTAALAAIATPALGVLPDRLPALAENGSSVKPYDSIEPPVKSDANTVRTFFSYACPHCRTYHNGLAQWGASLPSPLEYVAMPIITAPDDDNQILAVYGRLIGEALEPKCLPAYDYALFALFQGDPASGAGPVTTLSVNDVLVALVRAGIPGERIRAYLQGEEVAALEARIMDHAKVIQTYGIKATPSVAIAGHFLLNPDQTSGNAQQFLVLLNGIVSRVLEGVSHVS